MREKGNFLVFYFISEDVEELKDVTRKDRLINADWNPPDIFVIHSRLMLY